MGVHDHTDSGHCDDLVRELDHFLHGELPPERTAALQAHLHDCPPCFESADFQAQLRQVVARRCGEPLPDGLQARIIARLQVEVRDSADPGSPL